MLTTALQRLSHLSSPVALRNRTNATQVSAPSSEMPIKDRLQVQTLAGHVPGLAASISFASTPALDHSLQQLQNAPDERTAKSAQANFRVAIRSLDVPALQALLKDVQGEIADTTDFRTQRFLDKITVDVRMALWEKGAKLPEQPIQMPAVPGNTPHGIVAGTLKQLQQNPSEANFREARAGFRVALRQLSPEQLNQTRALIHSATSTSSDYRTQLLLDAMNSAITEEQITRGLKTPAPALKMPPVLSTHPQAFVQGALELLHKGADEAQFRTALASVRVSSRELSPESRQVLQQLLVAETKNSKHDYRTQVFLDQALREIALAVS
jgi:hypothetical protein